MEPLDGFVGVQKQTRALPWRAVVQSCALRGSSFLACLIENRFKTRQYGPAGGNNTMRYATLP